MYLMYYLIIIPLLIGIFIHREFDSLDDNEVKDFFIKSFKQLGISVGEDALNLMIHFSSGHPTMMHEICAGIYWTSKNEVITYDGALSGIIRACEEIGVKHLKSSLDSSIRSDKYLNIFNKLGKDFISHFDGNSHLEKKIF